jgi:hypothetical protein
MNIKNITEDVNWRTIPKAIKEEYSKNGHLREETHRRNDKGIIEVTYGGIMRPVFSHYKFENVDFFVNLKFIEHLDELMDLGLVFDEELNVVSNKNIKPFLIEYSKGFNKGYFEFESTFKKDNSLFNNSNEQIVYKVYSRVINEKKGSFPMYSSFELSQSDLEKKIRKEKGIKILFKLKKESFFNSGFEGGEFYKAWEIILNNPTIFEPIFIKANLEKETTKTEIEAIDLSDSTTATEKIIYLQKLGVIDFLRTKQPFISSINSLATVLSAVTGAKSGTIQPMLNAMLSKNVNNKNNPLNSQKPTKKVTNQLIQIRFNVDETI